MADVRAASRLIDADEHAVDLALHDRTDLEIADEDRELHDTHHARPPRVSSSGRTRGTHSQPARKARFSRDTETGRDTGSYELSGLSPVSPTRRRSTLDEDDNDGDTKRLLPGSRSGGDDEYRHRSRIGVDDELDHLGALPHDIVGSASERERRLIWWRRAGVNMLFIAAWYMWSTLISVYSASGAPLLAVRRSLNRSLN